MWYLLLLLLLSTTTPRVAESSSSSAPGVLSPSSWYERLVSTSKQPSTTASFFPTRVTGYGKKSKSRHHPWQLQHDEHNDTLLQQSVANNKTNLWVYQDPSSDEGAMWIYSSAVNKTIRVSSQQSTADADCLELIPHRKISLLAPNLPPAPPLAAARRGDNTKNSWKPMQGLYGVYRIPSGSLWVFLANDSRCVYSALGVCQARHLYIVRVAANAQASLSRVERMEEERQIALLRQSLKHHEWYFATRGDGSSTLVLPDLTRRLQICLDEKESSSPSSAVRKKPPDSRFFWNEAMVQSLQPTTTQQNRPMTKRQFMAERARRVLWNHHVIPVTSAFCGVQTNLTVPVNSSLRYDQLLLTRRSKYRAGTRFTKRGADHTGHVANYAETEQIILVFDDENQTMQAVCSHVQTRGSIPLRWSSPTDVKTYRPRVRIGTHPLLQARALLRHLVDQAHHYILRGSQNGTQQQQPSLVFCNLVDQKSDQGRLGRAFDAVLQAVLDVYSFNSTEENATPGAASHLSNDEAWWWLTPNAIRHVWFDFHAEVKHGQWHKLQTLLEEVNPALQSQDYFLAVPGHSGAFKVLRRQTGVVRTNCMDCLDRTNVVQSIFARYMLFQQLVQTLAALKRHKPTTQTMPLGFKTAYRLNPLTLPWAYGETSHRLLWADNADAVSRLYAGTPALKGDFTRTGKRTKRGALEDGMNSLQRYYLNNFLDADRQEGMDLVTGFQSFSTSSNVADSSSEEALDSSLSTPIGRMTLQDAARRALLGIPEPDTDDEDDDESRHVRIKNSGGLLDLRWLPGDLQAQVRTRGISSILMESSPALTAWDANQDDETGDDDEGVSNDVASTLDENAAVVSQDMLQAMDVRTASDIPWWVTADSSTASSSENDDEEVLMERPSIEEDKEGDPPQHQPQRHVATAISSSKIGLLLGAAMIAGAQWPLGMAAVVVTLLGTVYAL